MKMASQTKELGFLALSSFILFFPPQCLDIFDTPRSEIPSGDDQSQETSTITESAKVTYSVDPAPKEPPPVPIATESSGVYAQEIHRATDIQEPPVPSAPGVTVQESPLPPNPDENNQQDANVEHASAEGPVNVSKDSSTAHASDSESSDKVSPAHDPTLPPSATKASQDLATPNQSSDVEKTPQRVTVPVDSPASQTSRFSLPQNTQAPQGTHVSQLMYLHHQHDILSKPTPKSIVSVPPGKMEAGSKLWRFHIQIISYCHSQMQSMTEVTGSREKSRRIVSTSIGVNCHVLHRVSEENLRLLRSY